MKKTLFTVTVIIASACSSKNNGNKLIVEKPSIAEQNKVLARTGHIINNGKCRENNIDINPVVKFDKKIINQGELFYGKAYYPTNYFNKLAKCYNLTYIMRLNINSILTPITTQNKIQDTIFFKVRPDSLVRIRAGSKVDKYQFEARLRASFSDGVSGYDTTGAPVKTWLFVKKVISAN